ncbi:helix-turn-helix domain-containing protein, partial [Jeotgalibaca porci]
KIQKRYLIAIEENRLDDLPGDFFVNAFIRQYADVVGVSLKGEEQRHTQHAPVEGYTHESKEKVLPTRSELKRSSRETKFTYSNDSKSTLPTFLLVLMFLLILGAIWYYIFYMGDNNPAISEGNAPNQQMIQTQTESSEGAESSVESEAEAPQPATVVTASTEQTQTPTYSVTGLELPNTLSIEVDTTGNSWVLVTTEGDDPLFEGVIQGGSTQTIPLEEGMNKVFVRIGFLPSTTVKFGEATVEMPADYQTNQTQTLTFTIE